MSTTPNTTEVPATEVLTTEVPATEVLTTEVPTIAETEVKPTTEVSPTVVPESVDEVKKAEDGTRDAQKEKIEPSEEHPAEGESDEESLKQEPKRARSAYNFFVSAMQPTMKKDNPDMPAKGTTATQLSFFCNRIRCVCIILIYVTQNSPKRLLQNGRPSAPKRSSPTRNKPPTTRSACKRRRRKPRRTQRRKKSPRALNRYVPPPLPLFTITFIIRAAFFIRLPLSYFLRLIGAQILPA
jgi:hypothetical protein